MHTKDGHTIHDRTKQFKVRTKKDILVSSSVNPMLFIDLRAGEEAEAVQILPRHHVDQHHVPRQQHGPGDALPVPSQLGRLPGEAASLPDGLWPWLPVQLCLLPADGELSLFFCQLTMRDVVLALMKAVFLCAKVMPISTKGKTFLFACPTFLLGHH